MNMSAYAKVALWYSLAPIHDRWVYLRAHVITVIPSTCGMPTGAATPPLDRGKGNILPRELSMEEKRWCLEQAIEMVKAVGHGGQSNMRDAAGVLQNLYQTLCLLHQTVAEDA
jgi:hypothetical protein